MNFFRKLTAALSAPIPELPGGQSVEVVGESQYQRALNFICGGKNNHGHELAVEAELLREANNKHDRNAVAVLIRNHKVGYLSRSEAGRYAPMFDLNRLRSAKVKAVIRGGWKYEEDDGSVSEGNFGVWLDLAEPETCLSAIQSR